MKFNAFGPDGEQISALGLGCSRIGSFNNPASMASIQRTLGRALELGVTVLDTADIYGQGDSERVLGRFLNGQRGKAFVVSKIGKRFSLKMRMVRPLKPLLRPWLSRSAGARSAILGRRDHHMRSDFAPAYLAGAIEASLRRLRFEALDALLLHSPTAEDLANNDIEPLLDRLKRDGKIRYYGVSCDDMASLVEALRLEALTLLELPVDLIESARLSAVWPAIAARKIGVLAREVIRMQPDLAPGMAISNALKSDGITCVIAGTSRAKHIEELARAVS